jgi:hypothetical protein
MARRHKAIIQWLMPHHPFATVTADIRRAREATSTYCRCNRYGEKARRTVRQFFARGVPSKGDRAIDEGVTCESGGFAGGHGQVDAKDGVENAVSNLWHD